ncbi:Thymidine kinase, cytosolic [Hondaea fermentalgiana]|uniref:Thymidine kinase n=1 Tax=Hondaea fermentalgiana TaxID=2315210 RepID=A0A2R5GVZ5_9STRA|nr:Thymidine kinase, cytosolic [Hondaea fermentalgiana]|eukprot:GBG35012.1 Thymidine kinase, cytosolic [Hondaea fermentalgiana]
MQCVRARKANDQSNSIARCPVRQAIGGPKARKVMTGMIGRVGASLARNVRQDARLQQLQAAPRLRVIMGPMFSGKTSRLLQLLEDLEPQFGRCLVAKWSEDLRAGSLSAVSTHTGKRRTSDVHAFASLDDLELPGHQNLLVAVDEGQFFGDDLLRLHDRIVRAEQHHALIVAGLDLDFRKNPFGRMLDLADRADPTNVETLAAQCHICGAAAPFTSRIVHSANQVLVGGAESYQPTCAEHYCCPEAEKAQEVPKSPDSSRQTFHSSSSCSSEDRKHRRSMIHFN